MLELFPFLLLQTVQQRLIFSWVWGYQLDTFLKVGWFGQEVNACTVFMDICSCPLNLVSGRAKGTFRLVLGISFLSRLLPPVNHSVEQRECDQSSVFVQYLRTPQSRSCGLSRFLKSQPTRDDVSVLCSHGMVPMRAMRSELLSLSCQVGEQRLPDCHRLVGTLKWSNVYSGAPETSWFRMGALDLGHWGLDCWLHLFLTLWPWAGV